MNNELKICHAQDTITIKGTRTQIESLLTWIKGFRYGEFTGTSVNCKYSLDLQECRRQAVLSDLTIE